MSALTMGIRVLLAIVLPVAARAGSEQSQLVQRELEKGEAIVWYLGHSGWAVKTANHLLVFDYTAYGKTPEIRGLDEGFVDPRELAGLSVIVFVTHVHSDHFDETILSWRDELDSLRYVFGWDASRDPRDVELGETREVKKIGEATVFNVYDHFDDCPENSYLVRVDGVTLLHNGDHENWGGRHTEAFESNLRYLAEVGPEPDIAFVPCFDGQRRLLEILKPRFTFPMHEKNGEHRYERFAAANADLETRFVCAGRRGQAFLLRNGEIEAARLPAGSPPRAPEYPARTRRPPG